MNCIWNCQDGDVGHSQHQWGEDTQRKIGGRRLCQAGGRPRIGQVTKYRDDKMAVVVKVDKVEIMMGIWWMEAVSAGTVEYTPLVNASPKMTSRAGCGVCKYEIK